MQIAQSHIGGLWVLFGGSIVRLDCHLTWERPHPDRYSPGPRKRSGTIGEHSVDHGEIGTVCDDTSF